MTTKLEEHMARVSARMLFAAKRWPWDGVADARGMAVLEKCRRADTKTGASLLFTFDHGYHASGWWKNPDFDRCFHLSVAELAPVLEKAGFDVSEIPQLTTATREAWARAFFADTERLIWTEPAVSDHGKALAATHYRVFVDVDGVPILPRGEVYSRELTAAGWLSWSDVQAAKLAAEGLER
jgi:hypothetical protein